MTHVSLRPSLAQFVQTVEYLFVLDDYGISLANAFNDWQDLEGQKRLVASLSAPAMADATDQRECEFISKIANYATDAGDDAPRIIGALWPDAKACFVANSIRPASPATATATVIPAPSEEYSIAKKGDYWTVRFAGDEKQIAVHGNKGFGNIVTLLQAPHKRLHGLDLRDAGNLQLAAQTPQAMIDKEAMAQYKQAAYDLESDITDARNKGDETAAEAKQKELGKLLKVIQQAKGFNGRTRDLQPSSAESKAYDTVSKTARRAIDKMTTTFPEFGKYLDTTIQFQKPHLIYIPIYDHLRPSISWKF